MEPEISDHLKHLNKDLRNILLKKFPQFNSKSKLIPFYCKIENELTLRKQIEFWSGVLQVVLREYQHSALFNLQDFYNLFTLDKFLPLGLKVVIKQLSQIEDSHFRKKEIYIREKEDDQIMEKLKLNYDSSQAQKIKMQNQTILTQSKTLKKLSQTKDEKSQNQEKNNTNTNNNAVNQHGMLQNIIQKLKNFHLKLDFFGFFTNTTSEQSRVSNKEYIMKTQAKKFSVDINFDENYVYLPYLAENFEIFQRVALEILDKKYEGICGENIFIEELSQQIELSLLAKNDLKYMKDLLIMENSILRLQIGEDSADIQVLLNTENFVLISNSVVEKSISNLEESKVLIKWKNQQIVRSLEIKLKDLNKLLEENEKKHELLDSEIKELIQNGKREKGKRKFPFLKMANQNIENILNKIGVIEKMKNELKFHLNDSEAVDLLKISNDYLKKNQVDIEELSNIKQEMEDRQADLEINNGTWDQMANKEESDKDWDEFENMMNPNKNIQQNQNIQQNKMFDENINNNQQIQQNQQQKQEIQQQQQQKQKLDDLDQLLA